MKVTQEKLPDSQIGLDIEIPPEMSKNAYEQVVRKYTQTANIPGFRRGKVPRTILIQRLGSTRIKAAALDNLMQDHLPKVIEQENIPAIGEIEFRGDIDELIAQYQPGEPLVIRAKVDVEPQVQLGEYQGLQLQAEAIQYDPAKIDAELEKEQIKLATLVPVEDQAAQEGNVAFADFKGYFISDDPDAEPEEVPGGEAENFRIELTPGQFIPGFIEGMIGMQPGETKEMPLQFPEDYGNEELAGKPVNFTITLNELKERELPELDDEFAEEISEFKTMAELRTFLESQHQEEAENKTTENKRTALIKAIVAGVTLELPETLIRQEIDQIVTQQAIRLSEMGLDVKQMLTQEMMLRMREQARTQAIEQLKQALALKEIAAKESITLDEEEIKAEEATALKLLEDQPVDLQRLRTYVTEDLLRKKTFAWLEEHSTIELVPEGTLTSLEAEETETTETYEIEGLGDDETAPAIEVESSSSNEPTSSESFSAEEE
ncbi:MAG: trigger factor [Microcoleaceae cyanobacterium]